MDHNLQFMVCFSYSDISLYYGGDEGSTNVLAKTESWNGSVD